MESIKNINPNQIISVKRAAEILNISTDTIMNAKRNGTLILENNEILWKNLVSFAISTNRTINLK